MKKKELHYIPLALLGGFVIATALPALSWIAGLVIHESGHALASLFAGQLSIPTPFYTVPMGPQNSPTVIVAMLLAFAFVIYLGFKKSNNYLICLGFLGFNLQIFVSTIIPDKSAEALILIAGLAAELVLSPIILLAFFLTLPKFFNWQVNRYLFLVIAALTFTKATEMWIKAPTDKSALPYGAAIDFNMMSNGESGGDLNRLIRDFNWTEASLINLYWYLMIFSWMGLIAGLFLITKLNAGTDSN